MNKYAKKKDLFSEKISRIKDLYGCLLVTGPRQTGKTTLCRELFKEYEWTLFDDEGVLGLAKKDPALFLQNFPCPVILDEIQRATELFLALKHKLDSQNIKKNALYVLTGSQPLELMEAVSESLAGRIGIAELLPMTHSEIYESNSAKLSFDDFLQDQIPLSMRMPIGAPLQEILFRGGFPSMALSSISPSWQDVSIRFSDYTKTYLHLDLRDLALVQDLTLFEKFLRRFALSSATHRGVGDWTSDVGLPRTTIVNWLGLLLASYMAFEIPAYSSRLGRREKKRSKYHIVDSGLMSHLLAYQSPDQLRSSPILGQIFETYGLVSFRAWTQRSAITPFFYHWRLDEKKEVDLLFEVGDEIVAVEFKMTAKPNIDDLSGIKAFQEHYPKCKRAIVVSCFEHIVYLDKNTLNIPISAF